jgi:hypothetical protein
MSSSFNITKTYQNRTNYNQMYVQNKIQALDEINKQSQKNNKNVKSSTTPSTTGQVFISSTNSSGSRINMNQSSISDFY